MKTNWSNVLIGAAVLFAVVYVLYPSAFVSKNEGFQDNTAGAVIGIILFVFLIGFGIMAMLSTPRQ
jgi:hypothetical protein